MLSKTMYAGGRGPVPQEGFRSLGLATGPLWAVW